jgi:hypothetical protein
MKHSNVVKSFALVFVLSMPLAAFAAATGTGGAGAPGAAGTGATGTGGPSTGAPGAGTAGTGGSGPGTGVGNSTNPAPAAEPQQSIPPDKPTGIK